MGLTANFMEVNRFPSETKSIISQAKESSEYITRKTLSKSIKDLNKRLQEDSWNTHRDSSKVQCKFSGVCSLEKENKSMGQNYGWYAGWSAIFHPTYRIRYSTYPT